METSKAAPDRVRPGRRKQISDLMLRLMSGVPLLAVALICLLLGSWPWAVFMGVAAVIGVTELYALANGHPERGITWVGILAVIMLFLGTGLMNQTLQWTALLGAPLLGGVVALTRGVPLRISLLRGLMTGFGVWYVGFPLALSVLLSQKLGPGGVLLILAITAGSDTAAYFFGRWLGRTPLAPSISPKKTVEGMISGLLVGAVLAGIDLALIGRLTGATLLILAIGPILAVLGDLGESALKRRYNVKDSHLPWLDIIPGHGGVLDRADSLLPVVPFVVGYLALIGLL